MSAGRVLRKHVDTVLERNFVSNFVARYQRLLDALLVVANCN